MPELTFLEKQAQKHKIQKQLLLLEREEWLHRTIGIFRDAKKWIEAKEGDPVGTGRFYVELKSLELGDVFRGFGSGGSKKLEFPDRKTANIFGDLQFIGTMNITSEIADAFIKMLEEELVLTEQERNL